MEPLVEVNAYAQIGEPLPQEFEDCQTLTALLQLIPMPHHSLEGSAFHCTGALSEGKTNSVLVGFRSPVYQGTIKRGISGNQLPTPFIGEELPNWDRVAFGHEFVQSLV